MELLNHLEGNIFLTTGSKNLPDFTGVKDYAERIALRILPMESSLKSLLGLVLGLTVCVFGLAPETVYLDTFDLAGATCGLNKRPQANRSLLGNKLRLGGETFAHGVGTHAESVMFFRSNGKVKAFDAVVGIDQEAQEYPPSWCTRKNWGCASFRVYADGKKVADSGVLKERDKPVKLHAELLGAKSNSWLPMVTAS